MRQLVSIEDVDLELISPLHLELISDGNGQYPDAYKVTKVGLEMIKKYFKIIKHLREDE